MFSLPNQNQILYHLSQITNILTPHQTKLFSKTKQNASKKTINKLEQILFQDSLNNVTFPISQIVGNKTNEILEYLYSTKFQLKMNADRVLEQLIANKHISLNQLNMLEDIFYKKHNFKISNKISVNNSKKILWNSNFVSQNSFNENKLLHSNQNFVNFNQFRTFKTDRSAIAEKERNPSLFQRLKQILGTDSSSTSLKVGNVDRELLSNERLKQLLNNGLENTNENGKKNLKLAFAEGYVAGIGNQGPGGGGTKTSRYLKILQQLLTISIFFAIIASLMVSTGGSIFRIQLGNQVEVDPENINVKFDDVKGVDEAKQELKDIVEYLKNPDKFSTLGGKLPKGVLLVGPPGTGKTLLARAIAGEAGVPFFHANGPEFDEILVGQGARRVRDLFKSAKERAPCVIFIDEIDSVGAKRTNSVLHPYANQTINQLLSEMDGFHQNEGVIVLGATNRRDDLDPALLRPGRFDVEVSVPTPDYVGRKEILSLYLSKILAKGIDIELLARGTTGFTGADIENMVNQAALRAAIDSAEYVDMKYLENARDKVLMGPERKCRIPDEEANLITAYHEGGHAVVAYYTKDSNPLHKVTIIPRGPSLGHTAYIPAKEAYHVTKAQLLATLDTMMGGRAAEELIFGNEKITSGASSDLKQATSIVTHMVKEWGMSDKVGLRTLLPDSSHGKENLGPGTAEQVDAEIKRIMTESYERAKNILKTHAKEHKALAEALMKYETLDADDIKAIMSDKPPPSKMKTAKILTTAPINKELQ